MPSQKVRGREQGAEVERHLAAAAEYVAVAESSDPEKSAYEHAADEMIVLRELGVSFIEIDRRLGKTTRGSYSGALVRWRNSGSFDERGPFSEASGKPNRDQSGARKIARERPQDFAAAFEQAPPDAKRQIAERISHAPEVRTEARKRDHEADQRRQPSPVPPRTDHTLYEFESKLVSARRLLREALALVDRIDQPGDDEDIIDLLEQIKQYGEAVDATYRSGKSMDTWAQELYERSAD
jgi:hypothetical protein